MKNLSLVILAAGMGSRYGGLKQLDKISNKNDTIIGFSVYDAIEAGFTKIVFVIRKEFEGEFKKLFDSKLKGKVAYVYQELDNISKEFINKQRIKPWGTGHALLMAKNVIDENFAVINADDFYGKVAFEVMANNLQLTDEKSTNFYMVSYQLKNTISEFGSVSRGQCFVDKKGLLEKITELTDIEKINDTIFYKNDSKQLIKISPTTTVSMNFWGFTPALFKFLENEFNSFLSTNFRELKKEFFIPQIIDSLIIKKQAKVKVLECNAKWLGITYKEDKPYVVEKIVKLKENGVYPKLLW